jgi:selenocysteine lyase/cysteine desulfurase
LVPASKLCLAAGEGVGKTPYQLQWSYTGTCDYSPFLAFPAALAFRAQFGDAAIKQYNHNLAVSGGNVLAQKWGTDVLFSSDIIGAMVGCT